MAFLVQNELKVSVSTIPGDWDTGSGWGGSHATTRLRPSAGAQKVVVSGEYNRENVTTTRFVDPVRDADLLERLANGDRFPDTTVQAQPIDAAGVPIGSPIMFGGCSIEKYELSDADSNGEDPVKLKIEWTVAN